MRYETKMERKIHATQAQNYVALGSVIQLEWLICKHTCEY